MNYQIMLKFLFNWIHFSVRILIFLIFCKIKMENPTERDPNSLSYSSLKCGCTYTISFYDKYKWTDNEFWLEFTRRYEGDYKLIAKSTIVSETRKYRNCDYLLFKNVLTREIIEVSENYDKFVSTFYGDTSNPVNYCEIFTPLDLQPYEDSGVFDMFLSITNETY